MLAFQPLSSSAFEQTFGRAVEVIQTADLEAAIRLCRQAEAEARRAGRPDLADRAVCQRSAIDFEIGRGETARPQLRRILNQGDPELSWRAAYALTGGYRSVKPKLAQYYVDLALHHARELHDPEKIAQSLHLHGLFAAGANRFEQGWKSVAAALAIGYGADSPHKTMLSVSLLGFCYAMGGRPAAGLALVEESMELLRQIPSPVYETSIRLNAGFSLLEAGEPEAALEQAVLTLAQVEPLRSGHDLVERKHALFLAGEAASAVRDLDYAFHLFSTLQEEYYPEMPDLVDLLLQCPTAWCVNWLA